MNRQKTDNVQLAHDFVKQLSDDELSILMEIRDQRLGDKKKMAYSGASCLGEIYNRLRDALRFVFDGKHDVIHECCDYWAFLVKDQDRIISYFFGLRNDERGEYYVILAGVDKEYAWYSPSLSRLFVFCKNNMNLKIALYKF